MRTSTQRNALAALLVLAAAGAHADTSIFDFNGNLNATSGGGTLSYFNGTTTSNAVTFGTTSGFGITGIGGVNAQVLRFPAFAQNQGLLLDTNVFGNGGGEVFNGQSRYINRFTMGYDLLVTNNDQYFSFFNTNASNTNDGDAFIRPVSLGGGIGISGDYEGTVNANVWNRFVFTIDTGAGSTPLMRKYINGVEVGTTNLDGLDGRWSMYSDADNISTFLLTDNDGDTSAGYINSFYFADRVLSASEISAFGAANAAGFVTPAVAPEAGTFALLTLAIPVGFVIRRRSAR